WNSTLATFTARITVGAIARATAIGGTWTVLATIDDGIDQAAAASANHTVADYLHMAGTVADRDFGSISASGVSTPIVRTLSGIKANTNWDVSVEVVDDK